MSSIGDTARPFLRVTIEGELRYLTLKQYREKLSRELWSFRCLTALAAVVLQMNNFK